MSSKRWGAAVAVALVTSLAGCAGGAQDDPVRGAATTFYEAHASGDGAAACAVLAPRTKSELEQSAGKPCDQAVLEEDVPQVRRAEEVRVFGTQAQVRWDGETTFLARFQGGWRVMAAACPPVPGKPYDCSISGG